MTTGRFEEKLAAASLLQHASAGMASLEELLLLAVSIRADDCTQSGVRMSGGCLLKQDGRQREGEVAYRWRAGREQQGRCHAAEDTPTVHVVRFKYNEARRN